MSLLSLSLTTLVYLFYTVDPSVCLNRFLGYFFVCEVVKLGIKLLIHQCQHIPALFAELKLGTKIVN